MNGAAETSEGAIGPFTVGQCMLSDTRLESRGKKPGLCRLSKIFKGFPSEFLPRV
jgi:hypothetical protein